MSSWSEIRARTTDPLSSTINSLILRQNQANAISDEITDADTIFPVRILNSKLELSDQGLTSGYVKSVSQAFFMPFEPDGDVVRLWTRFDSGGVTVKDYSSFDNTIEIRHGGGDYSAPQPALVMQYEDDGISSNKIGSSLDKDKKHYFRITDPKFSLNNESFSFFFKILLDDLNNQYNHNKRAVLLDYIENDQVSHAVRVEMDDEGYLYFFVRWDYNDYYVKSDSPVITILDLPDYYSEDYDEEDYYASTTEEDQVTISNAPPVTASYIFCTFNKDTKVATILHPVDETTVDISSSSNAISIPQTANLSMWLPLTEGGGETLHDISGLDNDGTFSTTTPDSKKPVWGSSTVYSGRRHLQFDNDAYATIPNSTSLNTLSTFTISFFLHTDSNWTSQSNAKYLIGKDPDTFGNGAWRVLVGSGSSQTLSFEIKNNSGGTTIFDNTNTITADNLYHIVITYDGTNYKVYVDKTLKNTFSRAGDVFTNSNPIVIGRTTTDRSFFGQMYHVQFWKGVALSLAEVSSIYDTLRPSVIAANSDFLSAAAPTAPIFPPYWEEPDEPPAPGTPIDLPFTQVPYLTAEWTDGEQINAVTTSGLTSVYNVAGGEPVVDPVVVQYNVPEGVGTSGSTPIVTVYTLAPASSTGDINTSEFAYGQYIRTTSSALYNKIITDITIYLKSNGISGGTINIGIIKANGTTITFGAAVTGLTTSYQTFNRTNFTNTYAMQVGDAVGVWWTGASSGSLEIQRGGSGVHFESNAYSCQNVYASGSWDSTPTDSFSMAAIIKTGNASTTTTPWLTINQTTQQILGEVFSSTSAVANKTPTKIELKCKKKSGTTGTLSLQIANSSGVLKTGGTLKTWNIGTDPAITTSDPAAGVLNLVWEDVTNTVTIATNERLILTGGILSSGGEVYIMSNLGNNTTSDATKNHNSTSSYILKRTNTGTWSTYDTTLDITGKISTGGNNFTGYINLDNNRKRTGIKVDTATSTLFGKKITKVTTTLKKFGTPAAGAIYCRIRDSTGAIRVTLNQTDISSISTSDTSVDFINVTHNVSLELDDTISIEYDLGDSTNYVMVRINKNQFDSTNTILFESLTATPNTASVLSDRDLAAILYTGGVTDTDARPRVGLIVNTPNSSLYDRAITKMETWLTRFGTFNPDEMLTVKIVRGSDKATVATLGELEIQDITAEPTYTKYTFENTANNYVMKTGDMIVVENLYGNADNNVYISSSITDTVDGVDTSKVDWNGSAYNVNIDEDIYASFWTGGYTIYPDPDIPTAPTPYHYSHDMFFGASTTPDSEALVLPSTLEPDSDTMFSFLACDFRVYVGRLVGEEEALNMYRNKYTISALNFGEVNTVAHSTVSA